MKKYSGKEPEFFKWIRAVRDEMDRDTKDMTPEQYVDYVNARTEEARKGHKRLSPEQAKRERDKILYPSSNQGKRMVRPTHT